MKVFEKKSDLKNFIKDLKKQHRKIGFVPTMGALHEGHLALVKNSLKDNDYTVVSIFVNPTQFDNPDDLKQYPRTFLEDIQALKTLDPNIIVYSPQAEDIYDGEIRSESFDFEGLEKEMEGKHRPGHFDGVGTIVKKLFLIVQPDKAYFGEKDFQQLQIIKKLVEIENMPIEIIPVKIYREKDGLAMSSRNKRLTPEARAYAPYIYQVLSETQKMWNEKEIEEIKNYVKEKMESHPFLQLEYFEISDEKTLKPANEKKSGNKYRGFIVVYANDIRLIDNIAYN